MVKFMDTLYKTLALNFGLSRVDKLQKALYVDNPTLKQDYSHLKTSLSRNFDNDLVDNTLSQMISDYLTDKVNFDENNQITFTTAYALVNGPNAKLNKALSNDMQKYLHTDSLVIDTLNSITKTSPNVSPHKTKQIVPKLDDLDFDF